MISQVRELCKGYYGGLPRNIFQTVGKSFLYSFTISFWWNHGTLFVRNGQKFNIADPLVSGGLAALSALIYSLATPVFNKIFGNNEMWFHREAVKQFVSVFGLSMINYLTASKMNIIALNVMITRTYLSLSFPLLITPFSLNFWKATLDLFPKAWDWIDPGKGKKVRDVYQRIGIQVEPGSGSTFLSW